jgi:nucleoside-diphosphate-sugar epimerase
MVRLVERAETLEPFSTFHMEGHWDDDGTGMTSAIRRVVGKPDLKVRALPWGLLALASPLVPLFRELREMRYLWETPIRMNNARLVSTLGAEPHTPLDEAVRATLVGLGCLASSGKPSPLPATHQALPPAAHAPGPGSAESMTSGIERM